MQHSIHSVWLNLMACLCAATMLVAAAVDASACASEFVGHDVTELSDNAASPGDIAGDGEFPEAPEQHSSCAHGHCHHTSSALPGQNSAMHFASHPGTWRIGSAPAYRSLTGDGPKRPPRI
ncbi:hypothetical protein [Paraurantiacibacter namhicola]|uniref:hypothetical protein n=1 Tax=Paraurantiacibacter namhicola TaxID=645517 RepID=UPI0012EEC281|nr:hypothetical protein [Paraurantiacibacter namhicola]